MIKVRDAPASLWTTAARWAGARSAVVVDGRRPVLLTLGSITCGRLFLRGRVGRLRKLLRLVSRSRDDDLSRCGLRPNFPQYTAAFRDQLRI